jgi:hypothetical protein
MRNVSWTSWFFLACCRLLCFLALFSAEKVEATSSFMGDSCFLISCYSFQLHFNSSPFTFTCSLLSTMEDGCRCHDHTACKSRIQ